VSSCIEKLKIKKFSALICFLFCNRSVKSDWWHSEFRKYLFRTVMSLWTNGKGWKLSHKTDTGFGKDKPPKLIGTC